MKVHPAPAPLTQHKHQPTRLHKVSGHAALQHPQCQLHREQLAEGAHGGGDAQAGGGRGKLLGL